MRAGRAVAALLVAACLGLGADPFAEGVRAYRDGRYEDAHAAFAAAEADAGHGASAGLLHDLALAALRIGRLREAEWSAEKAVVRGGAAFAGFRDFVFGNAAWLRCQQAVAEAGLVDPDPTAFTRAITHGEAARDAWIAAATSRTDWPAARRNVERVQRALEELRDRKAAADAARKARQAGSAEEQPAPAEGEGPSEEVEQAPELQTDEGALSAAELERLLAQLAAKEREKQALRRATRAARSSEVERDW